MQDAETASALGVAPDRVYAATFAAGAALSGLAGALLAPLSGVVPTMGAAYIARAFITVIAGAPPSWRGRSPPRGCSAR
jgi:urea transport system permease protein